MFGALERLQAFGARTFPFVIISNIRGSGLTVYEIIAGVDCMMR
jgi:hypothetical protein